MRRKRVNKWQDIYQFDKEKQICNRIFHANTKKNKNNQKN